MFKLDPATPETDEGWVYATVSPAGQVTSAGRVASCMGCHETSATHERLYGVPRHRRCPLAATIEATIIAIGICARSRLSVLSTPRQQRRLSLRSSVNLEAASSDSFCSSAARDLRLLALERAISSALR